MEEDGQGGYRGPAPPRDFVHPLAVTLDDCYNGRVSHIGMERRVRLRESEQENSAEDRRGDDDNDEDDAHSHDDGTRTRPQRITLRVVVPPGAVHHHRLVFPGMSDEEPGSGLPPADVVLVLREIPHPQFCRNGRHLLHARKVPLVNALRGDVPFDIDHLDGRTLRVTAPRAARAVEAWRVRGEGMPVLRSEAATRAARNGESWSTEYGDLFVVRGVSFPDWLSPAQQATLRVAMHEDEDDGEDEGAEEDKTDTAGAVDGAEDRVGLLPGWHRGIYEEERVYYWHDDGRSTSWDVPNWLPEGWESKQKEDDDDKEERAGTAEGDKTKEREVSEIFPRSGCGRGGGGRGSGVVLRNASSSEFRELRRAFPDLAEQMRFYATPAVSTDAAATTPQAPTAGDAARSRRGRRRWSIDEDFGFDDSQLDEAAGECDTQ